MINHPPDYGIEDRATVVVEFLFEDGEFRPEKMVFFLEDFMSILREFHGI